MKKSILKLVYILVTSLIGLSSCESEIPNLEPTIIGHRGLAYLYPESSKESFDALLANRIFNVETDILMAANDSVMIFHDLEVSRLTNLSGYLISMTVDSIRKGIKAKSGGTGLTLNQFINLYSDKFNHIYLDLKQHQGKVIYSVIDQVIALVQSKNLYKKIIITSPDLSNLQYIQNIDDNILLATDEGEIGVKNSISNRFKYTLIELNQASKSLYNFAKSANVNFIIYTTENIIEVEKAIVNGCDGVMTDVPLEMKKLYSF